MNAIGHMAESVKHGYLIIKTKHSS